MKKIEAYVRVEKLEAVKAALERVGVQGLSVCEVRGRGEEKGITLDYRGSRITVDLLPRVKIEVYVEDELVDKAVEAIMEAAWTGRPGDGRVFVLPVEAAYRVRTRSRIDVGGRANEAPRR